MVQNDVKTVQREMQAWYERRTPATTPAFRAAFEDVHHGLDVYVMNKGMMSPELMRGLAQSVAALANYTCGTHR